MATELIGQPLPTLILPSTDGDVSIPEDLLGSYTVLFFYPKDQTPGCTKEACSFRDNYERFKKLNTKVYGVSSDSLDSHQDFIDKHMLNFPLLSDKNKQLAKALSVSSLLGMFSRDTFLIDPQGRVAKIWRKVDALETVDETIAAIERLNTAPMPID